MGYLTRGWREFLSQPASVPGPATYVDVLTSIPYRDPLGDVLEGADSASYDAVRTGLLDPHSVDRAILSYGDAMFTPARVNTYLAREVARAANDWTIDQWLSRDERLYSLILVPNQVPEDAVAEIRRVGDNARMVGVLMAANSLSKPFGHPLYHPIYEAAAERDLPIVIHVGGDAIRESLSHTMAGGIPSFHAEYAIFAPQAISTHVVSLILQGVFEKYPTLRVLIVGAGAAWVPAVLWRCDTDYSAYRREVPWVQSQPSEYLRRHVRISTYPLDSTPEPETLVQYLNAYGGMEDLLVYASGYPARDTDFPDAVGEALPSEWHERVFRENALELFRWSVPDTLRALPEAPVGVMQSAGVDRPRRANAVEYDEAMVDTE